MISIQSAMLVALGFLSACLLILLFAPAFWSRAVRLTTQRIKQTVPLSEVEIRADKDRIRAEYAIKVHKLETEIGHARHATARQSIELNRRDATINALERELEALKASHEEASNARRVLEQTVVDRLPRVEQRLNEAKELLHSRDREIAALTKQADRQSQAMAAAEALNTQLRSETERLQAALDARTVRSQANGPAAANAEIELSLRSELEALRARAKSQAQLIARLQGRAADEASGQEDVAVSAPAGLPDIVLPSEALTEAERQVRTYKARNEDQANEIARLKAALDVFESQADAQAGSALRESKISLKARLQALEAQTAGQAETIQKLRSDLAAANERLARQAGHFMSELKRLGAGSLQTTGRARRANLVDRGADNKVSPADANIASVEAPSTVVPLNASAVAVPAEADPAAADTLQVSQMAGDAQLGAEASVESRESNKARPRLLERIASLNRSH